MRQELTVKKAVLKPCRVCGIKKPLDAFYRQHTAKDGRLYRCKECYRKWVVSPENRKRLLEDDRKRYYKDAEKNRKRRRELYRINKGKDKNKVKRNAVLLVNQAVKQGKILRPKYCSRCGSDFHVEGHHPDYSKPLEVIWLCTVCHKEEHVRIKQQAKTIVSLIDKERTER